MNQGLKSCWLAMCSTALAFAACNGTPSVSQDGTGAAPFHLRGTADATDFVLQDGSLRPRFRTVNSATSPTVDVRVPLTASGTLHVADTRTPVAVDVTLVGARPSAAIVEHGDVVFPGGAGSGRDVLQRARLDGVEDYVRIHDGSEPSVLGYQFVLHEVAGLRLVANTLELLDADGTPRLRVTPPSLIDARGQSQEARLAVGG
ncbi:MAG: hypothetical protein ACRENE_10125, partial [Polyangiaceae bacterium]